MTPFKKELFPHFQEGLTYFPKQNSGYQKIAPGLILRKKKTCQNFAKLKEKSLVYRSGQVENATAKFVHYIILVDDDPRASVVNIVSEVKKNVSFDYKHQMLPEHVRLI